MFISNNYHFTSGAHAVPAVRLKYNYVHISQYKIKIHNSLGNTLKIYVNQYSKHLI